MHFDATNPMDLEQQAVKAAVAADWPTARDLNLRILTLEPNAVDAKVRLGKAYLELRDYTKAKKYFREVLAVDPINTVAQKNYQLAKEEKHSPATQNGFKNLIKEPATYAEVRADIIAKGFTASKIATGAVFVLKVLAAQTKVIYSYKDQPIELAVITDAKMHKRLKAAKDQGATLSGTFVKGTDKELTVLLTSSLPIFDCERQELKPYTKRDFMDSDNEPPEPVIEDN
jgi:tetratricopeptide (TPR) repeat protein